jgi:beta-phosphoglucomutase
MTTSTPMQGVLWDLDGTLVDSGELHWWAWRDALGAEGVAITREQFLDSFGQKNDRILRTWLGPAVSAERIQRLGDSKESEFRRLAATHGLQALPGAAEWVERLHDAGWKQAIASSAPRANVEVMLRALSLDRWFDAIVSAEDVTHGKPDPEVFLTAAARLGVVPGQAIVVEDAAAGIEAARRAGIKSIGVTAGAPLDADLSVRSLDELPPDAFERLLAG